MRSLPLVLSTILLVSCTAVPTDTGTSDESSSSSVSALPQGTFGQGNDGGFVGDVYVRGYVTTEEVGEPFCNEDCRTFTYTYFRVVESGDEDLYGFLAHNEGNAYAQPNAIGLGCVQNGQLHFVNDSDQFRMREQTLSQPDSDAILISSETQLATLHLTRYALSGGSEAPACYSHFSLIEVARD